MRGIDVGGAKLDEVRSYQVSDDAIEGRYKVVGHMRDRQQISTFGLEHK